MVFFLAGVHGVGKTSLCSKLAEELRIPTISAGQLIRQQTDLEAWACDKKTSEIPSNQQKLLTAIRAFEKHTKAFLLDGHFALLDHAGYIMPIEQTIFWEMGPVAVILIEDDPFAISQRLKKRDQVQWDTKLIKNLQIAEKKGALSFCKKSNTPLLTTGPSDYENIREFIINNIGDGFPQDPYKGVI